MSFNAISWAIAQRARPPSAKYVLIILASHSSNGGLCFPSIKSLCETTGHNRKTVLAGISKLVASGFISDTGQRKGGTNQIKVYALNTKPEEQSQNRDSLADDNSAETGTVKQSLNRNSPKTGTVPVYTGNSPCLGHKQSLNRDTESVRNQSGISHSLEDASPASPNGAQGELIAPEECGVPPEPKAKTKGPTPEQVETIYQAYPRKEGRGAGLDAIRKALLTGGVSYDELLRKVRIYAECRAGQETKYTPYPQKWFNQKRWQDDPASWRAASKPDTNGKPYVKSLQEKELDRLLYAQEHGNTFYG